MMQVAAVGDLHFGEDSRGTLASAFNELAECADVLLLAGDLTRLGREDEMAVLVEELDGVSIPIVAVLGNHEYESDHSDEIVKMLDAAGIQVLEGSGTELSLGGRTLGIAGSTGFGGGFAGASGSDFGELEMKAFISRTKRMAQSLGSARGALRTDLRIALLHYSPVKDTLGAERREIYPFLGSYLLAEAIDRAGADLIIHGHAHRGSEQGVTAGGIPVRNVALPVIGRAFRLYSLP